MSDRPNIIWSNENLDYEDWQEFLEEEYPDLTGAQREELMYELNASYLDNERVNLNIQLPKPRQMICTICVPKKPTGRNANPWHTSPQRIFSRPSSWIC